MRKPGADSQNIADDPDGPHVGCEADGFVVDDFGRDEFGGSEQHAAGVVWVKSPRQTEIDQLDLMGRTTHTQNVLGLKGHSL